jgi:tRNA1(Val) A37 N6-methylase TrmN6
MARLMSQIKGGYYAAHPQAVAAVLARLRPPQRGECLILDPCAGEGHALVQLAESLHATGYGIELSEDRAAKVRESLTEGQALAPADFLRCAISPHSFSFVWCNPPYDLRPQIGRSWPRLSSSRSTVVTRSAATNGEWSVD